MKTFCSNILLCFVLLFSLSVQAKEPDWTLYESLLKEYVGSGEVNGITLNLVDYSTLSTDSRFINLVRQLAEYPVSNLNTREEQLAFYINAYNILTLKTVVDNWPLKSIKDVGSWIRPVWKLDAGKIDKQMISLDEIEHEILRPMGEPRIHFAIVCASLSCPDLRTEAYKAETLDQQLDDQTKIFLKNPDKGLKNAGSKMRVSKLFDWFSEDFGAEGGVQSFIKRYLPADKRTLDGYLDYSWRVNGY
ncbi:DUF547 domain-containing protein [Motiliproteus sp. MSK22-1]|uniref:DUF547 domain-containing protein n=1 Tax=Motiliproteus sp. MSK22-1 TaxID=1897630 RepID=UPI000976F8EE|nr:DUF547 domain-containing protein [Motiliproteus sp. MSK22-1]OMH32841.1 hypothetical protein BGP75_15095 [Motiliproteus sp. MSK22-1]